MQIECVLMSASIVALAIVTGAWKLKRIITLVSSERIASCTPIIAFVTGKLKPAILNFLKFPSSFGLRGKKNWRTNTAKAMNHGKQNE
jgi:hypothetical protein